MRIVFLLGIAVLATSCLPSGGPTALDFNHGETDRTPASEISYNMNMEMTTRSYTASVLKQAFNVADGSAMDTYINAQITQKIEFGGACDQYGESDLNATTVEFKAESCTNGIGVVQTATSNPMRFSITTKVCEDLIANATAWSAVKSKIIGAGVWTAPTDSQVKLAWDLFYPLEDINKETLTALKDIRKATSTDEEAWKAIIFTLCSSPGWQAI